MCTIHPEFFYKLIPLPFLGGYFFCIFNGNSLWPQIFFVTPMCGAFCFFWGGGGWKCVFVIFTEIIPRRILFLYCENVGVDGMRGLKGSKRCFPNGVFQIPHYRHAKEENPFSGTKNARKHQCFLCCLYGRIDCAQWWSRMEWTSSADVYRCI